MAAPPSFTHGGHGHADEAAPAAHIQADGAGVENGRKGLKGGGVQVGRADAPPVSDLLRRIRIGKLRKPAVLDCRFSLVSTVPFCLYLKQDSLL